VQVEEICARSWPDDGVFFGVRGADPVEEPEGDFALALGAGEGEDAEQGVGVVGLVEELGEGRH